VSGASEWEYAVVGGGIAGLAVAEALARGGHSVVLIERNQRLCQEASAAQHGWFHLGSLYSILPRNQFLRTMVGGVEDLISYYGGFPGMNIAVTDDGRLSFPPAVGAWFRDEPIEYIVAARNDADFDMRTFGGARRYAEKLFFLLTWEMAIKQFISRHQRFHKHDWSGALPASQWIPRAGWRDYSRAVISKPNTADINLDRDTHFRIVGFDRPMRATAIISDLARGLVGAGGSVLTGREVVGLEDGGSGTLVHTDGETLKARTAIVAAGKWLGRFVAGAADVRVVGSPLLVAYPAVADANFVRMTPFVDRSVNHLRHRVNGREYSLVGGGHACDPDDPGAAGVARERLMAMAERVFPRLGQATVVQTYLGSKTEIAAASGERNYQYFIRQIGPSAFAVTPGKFSLAFSLAVNACARLTGAWPSGTVRLAPPAAVADLVGQTRHATIVAGATSAAEAA